MSKTAILLVLLLAVGMLGQFAIPTFASSAQSVTPIPTGEMVQYHLPNGSSQPWGITVDPGNGLVWFVEQGSNQVGSFNPATGNFSEYNIPTHGSLPETLAVDSSHNVWISELYSSQLGELPSGKNTITQYNIPTGPDKLPCGPIGITPYNDGNIWLTCEFSNQIDEFFPKNFTFHEFNLPIFYSAPLQIVFDHSGNFWFTAADSNMLGYATVSQLKNGTTNGINEFPPVNGSFVTTIVNPSAASESIASSLSTPSQFVLSPDGRTLWITEHTASSFDRFNVNTRNLVKYWTSQTYDPNYVDSLPNGDALDNNGILWIAEHYANKIAEFNPATEQLIEYPIPCCSTGIAGTLYLAVAPDGGVWFSEFFGNAIGEVKSSGFDPLVGLTFSNHNGVYNLTSSGNLTVPIKVSFHSPKSNSVTLNFQIAGLTYTGELQNLTNKFIPSSLTIANGSSKELNLNLAASGLVPGSHYLTIGARDTSNNVTYSVYLKLNVTNPEGNLRSLLTEGLIIGIVASVVVVGALLILFRSRKVVRRKPRPRRG